MDTFAYKGDAPSPQLHCSATRAGGGARKAQAPVSWVMGAAFGARTLIAEFMPRLWENGVGSAGSRRRTQTMTEGNVAGSARSRRRKNYLAEGITLEALVPAAGMTP